MFNLQKSIIYTRISCQVCPTVPTLANFSGWGSTSFLLSCFASVSASIVPSQQRDDGQASTTVEDDALWSPDFHLPPFGPKSKSSTHLDRSEDGEVLLSEEEEAAALALARRPEYQQVAAFVSVKVYFTEGYERESGGDVQRKVTKQL